MNFLISQFQFSIDSAFSRFSKDMRSSFDDGKWHTLEAAFTRTQVSFVTASFSMRMAPSVYTTPIEIVADLKPLPKVERFQNDAVLSVV